MLAMQGAPAAKGVKTLRNTPLPWEEEEDSAKIRNPSVGPRLSFRIRRKGEREDASVQQLLAMAAPNAPDDASETSGHATAMAAYALAVIDEEDAARQLADRSSP